MIVDRTVLIVEDDPEMGNFLASGLRAAKARVWLATSASQALRLSAELKLDLVILDLGLPDLDGQDVLKAIRKYSDVPILIASARGEELQKVRALDAGADDYLVKPFGLNELLARLRVLLRRTEQLRLSGSLISMHDVVIDVNRHAVTKRGNPVHLSPIEYNLLHFLAKAKGGLVTQRALLREVWGPAASDQTHYLRIYMGKLRQKLEDTPADPKIILTEAGIGYRLNIESS
jgi:two-component system KDP operon response regulator KdpE